MPTKMSGRIPKHQELTRTLLELARSLKPGDAFPSQSELMRRYQVSDRTVLRSLDDLQRGGWILRRHGVGTFVTDRTLQISDDTPSALVARSKTIAAMVLALGPVYQHFVDLLADQAAAGGLSLICHHAHSETSFEDTLPLTLLNPQGFVLFSYYLLPIAKRLQEQGHRVVIVGAPPPGVFPELSCIYNDQDNGGRLATRHLMDLGHRRIAYVVPETRYPFDKTMRWHGYQRALDEASKQGIAVQGTIIEREEWLSWRTDAKRCAAFFARPDAPTGLLLWNDDKAVKFLHILNSAGVRVPDDVSVVGYDALPIGKTNSPALTTVDSQIETQLRAVMQFLTQPYAPPPTHSVMVTPTLIVRDSTAAPRTT